MTMPKNLDDIIAKLNPTRRKRSKRAALKLLLKGKRGGVRSVPKSFQSIHGTIDPHYFAVDEDEGLVNLTADLERALSDAKERRSSTLQRSIT